MDRRVARDALIWIAAGLLVAVPGSFLLGFLVGPLAGLAFSAAGFAAMRTPVWRQGGRFSRQTAWLRAASVAVVAAAFLFVLVRDRSDNAYLWIAMMGVLLGIMAAIFAVTAIVATARPGEWIARGAILVLWIVCGIGMMLMLIGGPLYWLSSAGVARHPQVLAAHVIGFVLLAQLLWFMSFRHELGVNSRE